MIPPECPKCGDVKGFEKVLPVYSSGHAYPYPKAECLAYPCRTCGYVIETPTKDAPCKHNFTREIFDPLAVGTCRKCGAKE
jgi:hypothetical protein